MGEEVLEAGLGNLEALLGSLVGGDTGNLVGVALALSSNVGNDIIASLLNVTSDIESVTRSLGDGKTVCESRSS